MKRLNQSGSHVVALLVGVLVIGVIGLAGYKVMQAQNDTTLQSSNPVTTSKAAPKTIKTNADLTQAAKALDSSSSQVDGSLNDNALNASLNDML